MTTLTKKWDKNIYGLEWKSKKFTHLHFWINILFSWDLDIPVRNLLNKDKFSLQWQSICTMLFLLNIVLGEKKQAENTSLTRSVREILYGTKVMISPQTATLGASLTTSTLFFSHCLHLLFLCHILKAVFFLDIWVHQTVSRSFLISTVSLNSCKQQSLNAHISSHSDYFQSSIYQMHQQIFVNSDSHIPTYFNEGN